MAVSQRPERLIDDMDNCVPGKDRALTGVGGVGLGETVACCYGKAVLCLPPQKENSLDHLLNDQSPLKC